LRDLNREAKTTTPFLSQTVQPSQCEEADENKCKRFTVAWYNYYQSMPETCNRKGVFKDNKHRRTPKKQQQTNKHQQQNKTKKKRLAIRCILKFIHILESEECSGRGITFGEGLLFKIIFIGVLF